MFFLSGAPVFAYDQWTGATNLDWFTGSNWLSGNIPNAATSVYIDQGTSKPAVIDNGNAVSNDIRLGTFSGAAGKLNIQNGGVLTSNLSAPIGYSAGGSGVVTVSGSGSLWNLGPNDVYIGYSGIGVLNITNAGAVANGLGDIGLNAGASGAVTVSSGGNWLNTGNLIVGDGGSGTLTIDGASGGATVINNLSSIIGYSSGSNGKVTVTAGGHWTSKEDLIVGQNGAGKLTISNGGTVSQGQNGGFAYVGQGAAAIGSVMVTGSGSSLAAANDLYVGVNGSGALFVENGGAVTVGGTLHLAQNAGSRGALVIGEGMTPGAPGLVSANAIVMGNGDGEIVFTHTSSNYIFSIPISGRGSIFHDAGVTDLTGDSSGFTGGTSIFGGTLKVNGSLGGTITVDGGILGGSGTVGGLTVNAGGTVAPGNSIGTLNVAGSVAFNAGSIYQVEVNAVGQSDKISATGAATINGGTVQVLAGMGNYAAQTQYTILTANGGRTGTFNGVTSNLTFLDPSLSYDAKNVYLTMTRNNMNFAAVGLTPNQIATGGGVESLGFGNPIKNAVLNLSAPQARNAFDQLSGEVHASAKTALIEDSHFVRDAAVDRLRAAFDAIGAMKTPVMSYASVGPEYLPATTDRFALWGRAFGSWGHTDGDANVARLNRSTGGLFVGGDGLVAETSRVGLLAGYSHTNFNVRDRNSSGTSDNYHVGLYGGTQFGSLAFRTGAAYTWHDISTSRSVAFPGYFDISKGKYDARTAQVFGELAYGVRAATIGFEPFVNLAYVNLHTDGFRETGGVAALTSNGGSTDATFSTLGLRASSNFVLGGVGATARGTLGWRHVFGDVTPLSAMAFASGSAFTIAGVPIARNAAVIEAGFDLVIRPNATLGVSYSGQFASAVSDQSIRGNLNWRF